MPKVRQQTRKGTKNRRGSKGVVGRIAPVEQPEGGLKINFYGRSGTGKTTLAASFAESGPVLFVKAEDGMRSVANVPDVHMYPQKGRLEDHQELRAVIDYLKESPEEYTTIVLDTATAFQDLVLRQVLDLEELPAQRTWGMAKRDDWMQCGTQTKEYLRSFLALHELGLNVIILAQERDFGTDGDMDLLMPCVASALQPGVVGWLNPEVDYIGQTFIREQFAAKTIKVAGKKKSTTQKTGGTEYCLRVGPHPVYTTKFRTPKGRELPEVLVDPTYESIAEWL